MQSDNAPNLTAEVSNEFMRASQVTKVTSTAGHPRTQGLVQRQNRTLLTLLRVFCSRRMRDWDQHLDEVMGAYNSTRHATTGFSPYMLTRGTEKAIPLTYLYPEFAARSFESHGAYVEHILARQQEIHDLVRRNTHQAQQRQKLKYDRAIRANAYNVGDPVWVFCRYVPQRGSPKLMRAWRGPHKVVHVLQDGRVYILDSGQKVHFERLKHHHGGPRSLLRFPRGVAKWSLSWILSLSTLLRRSEMTAHNPRIARKNRCLKHQMYRYHQGDATGWTPGCVLECELEAVVSTISNLTFPVPTQSVRALTTCCQMPEIVPRLNLQRYLKLQCLPMNNFGHLNLPMTTSFHFYPNLKLFRRYLNRKIFPLQLEKPKYH